MQSLEVPTHLSLYNLNSIQSELHHPLIGLFSDEPNRIDLEAGQKLLEGINNETVPLMLLFVHDKVWHDLKSVIAIPDPSMVDIFNSRGEQLGAIMSRWDNCGKDILSVRNGVRKMGTSNSSHKDFVPGVIVVCKNYPSIQLVGDTLDGKEFAVGYLYKEKVKALSPKIFTLIQKLQI